MPQNDPFSKLSRTFGEQPSFFAFSFGILFILLIMIVALAVKDPSPFQYLVFRIILSLAGAGFAASLTGVLQLKMRLPGGGTIKAAAGFAVFIILYFFSPVALVAAEERQAVLQIKQELTSKDSAYFKARETLESIFDSDYEKISEKLLSTRTNLDRQGAIDARVEFANFIKTKIEHPQNKSAFIAMLEYYKKIVNCVTNRKCDQQLACSNFFIDIEQFRQTFCEQISRRDQAQAHTTAIELANFAHGTCKLEFLSHYIDDIFTTKPICLPRNCWATTTDDQPICEARKQSSDVVFGSAMPSK